MERRGNYVGRLEWSGIVGVGLVLVMAWDLVEDGEDSLSLMV